MSIARKAVRGAVWTIALSVGSRAFGLVSTILLAYFITPVVDGEAKAAWIVSLLASTATRFGVDQYLIVKQRDGEWHSSAHQGTLTLMVPVGLSIGYSGRDKSPLLAPFVSYEVFLMHGYNASVPLLPNRLLQVGVRSHFAKH